LSRHAFGNREEFLKAYRRSFDVLAIFAIPIMCYLYLRAADIINLIGGRDFGQSVGVLKVLSVAIMLIFFGNLAGNALVALNLQKKGVWVYMVGAVFNVGANLVLIPRYSFMATAWTTVLTELLITFLLFWLIKKQTQATVRFSIAVKSILAAAITCLALSFGHFHFIVFSLLSLVYFPILYLFGGFTIDDFKTMLMLRPPRPVIE
jgi:O-antigen/teichoic acid export membrane protein